ncbi:MAG: hypothetical protein L6427_12955 [Actinomycetia bacterium]|nr:hypothetical protein [Actinomycetes bacterium]
MNRSRRRERLWEYKETLLGIACTLVGIAAAMGISFLLVWAVVSIFE